ncbi:hypothetical protein ACFU6R_30150 [Streptomyces sp. NPDC057499]|uniref:hypothetical protein n=1 Tax=Streptomyces sp. NPDC057499 TaxID=3346150 RepID=UPI0036A059A7
MIRRETSGKPRRPPPGRPGRRGRAGHVLIHAKAALGTGSVSPSFLERHLLHQGVHLERIRGDRVLHEALTVGAGPLHLALVLNLSHTSASRYAAIARSLFDDQIEQSAQNE